MSARVSIEISANVAEVILDRADKLNALDLKMFSALAGAADSIAADSSIRAVVIYGAGNNFSAGIDLGVLTQSGFDIDDALHSPIAPSPANIFQRAAYAWRELSVPVICSLEGVVFGGGLQVALGADIRYCSENARFSIMESKWGLIPDMAISTTLRNLVAADRIKELAWTARLFDSAEAAALGFVTAVVDDPLTTCRQLAAACAARSPDAIRGIKTLVNAAWQVSDAESLALEARLQAAIIGGKNQLEAVNANLAGRKPEFCG